MRYAVGRAESGCRYHVALPITDGLHEGVAGFYGKIEAALFIFYRWRFTCLFRRFLIE